MPDHTVLATRTDMTAAPPKRLAGMAPAVQWSALIALSLVASGVFAATGLPAALLLGPMVAGIVVAANGAQVRIPRQTSLPVQAVIGCMIAKMLPPAIFAQVGAHWPLFAFGVLSVIAASTLLGWLLMRLRVLPGSTAVWGLSPGAATVMILMAEAHDADPQMVALLQYLRVLIVATVASIAAALLGAGAHHVAHAPWFAPIAWGPFASTLALAWVGGLLGRRLPVSAGPLLVPLVAGVALMHAGWITIELPRWLLAVAYALVGWRVGLQFTPALLRHAARALPRLAACSAALVVACAALAALLVTTLHVDPLTAWLAMSPGGADSVAIIAASTNVDVPFVMAMQMMRFVVVVFAAPPLARLLMRYAPTARRDRGEAPDHNLRPPR
ncbi:MAG TPA: AbrB family transcriptional regulator [Paraburkholderia sp.]|jgi:membrane AbrB-like protein|nr:AbrB family transcriptional regulator [Paraburkholderia sp.]